MNSRKRLFGSMAVVIGVASCVARIGAAEPNDELSKGAAERIEKHRKADAVFAVVDENGAPVKNAQVSIEQTRHAFLFGCNFFRFGHIEDAQQEEAYRRRFAALFNYATLGFYWPSYERRRGAPQHEYATQVATWCKEHGITAKGHPLAWNFADPRWLPDDSSQVRRLQMERITDCVTRHRGLIDIWDVVNEATHFERDEFKKRSPKLTRMWLETGRVPFVVECFKAARAANPNATLLINDYRTDPKYAELITELTKAAGKRPYDVIGIQSHMHGGVWANKKIWDACERFSRFDVPLHFTELTVLSGVAGWERARDGKSWDSTPDGERSQAEQVARIYTMLFSHPSVTAITWWDFSDQGAWQSAPAGLIDKQMKPKPAYNALLDLVKKQWWTRVKTKTDIRGQVTFRGFLGDYVIQVKTARGKVVEVPLTLTEDGPRPQHVVVRVP